LLRKVFGRNLKYQRKKRSLTQEKAAEVCGMSWKYWGKLERGDQAATIDVIEKISKGFQIPASELLMEEERDSGKGA
jgi:transcriptional regulator with XRE-family HTH domain